MAISGTLCFLALEQRLVGETVARGCVFPPERKCQHFTWAITGQRKARARGEYISKRAPREHRQILGLNYAPLSNPPYNSALSNVVTSQTSPHPIILISILACERRGGSFHCSPSFPALMVVGSLWYRCAIYFKNVHDSVCPITGIRNLVMVLLHNENRDLEKSVPVCIVRI